MGFFGPIGVSSIFYLHISLDFLDQIYINGDGGEGRQVVREDAEKLKKVFKVVVWFLAICSIVIHGLSVPVGKLGYHLPRTISSRVETQSRVPSLRGEGAEHELDERPFTFQRTVIGDVETQAHQLQRREGKQNRQAGNREEGGEPEEDESDKGAKNVGI